MPDFIDLKDDLVQMCLPVLLRDKTTKKNIVFATDSYASLGENYGVQMQITKELLKGMDLKPRILKSQEEQAKRTRKKAEVFTPAWLCCKMNNYCDDEWFGRTDVFNHLDGEQWTATEEPIQFPKKKTWKKYVDSRRLEITCGEAPFVVSRYDAATGDAIPIKDRVGMLDRKLRIVNENTEDKDEWIKWTLRAFQSMYGYEFQGDSLLIARINLFMTFIEYYQNKWTFDPLDKVLVKSTSQVANVISWNFWQMDGLTGTIPYAVSEYKHDQMSLFDLGLSEDEMPVNSEQKQERIECRIYDWRACKSLSYSSLKRGQLQYEV